MSNMTPVTFLNSVQPLITLPRDRDIILNEMIRAADKAGSMLRMALKPVMDQGTARDAVVEEFFVRTEPQFHEQVAELKAPDLSQDFATRWIGNLRRAALYLFDMHSVPGLDARDSGQQAKIIKERISLLGIQPKKFTDFTESITSPEGEVA